VSVVSSQLSGVGGLVLVVRLPAQLVDDTSALIREEVLQRLPNAEGAGLVLDCADVSLINSIGITCLLQVQDHCRRMKASMRLAAIPPSIERFLRTVKLDKRFPSAGTVEEAVGALDAPG
jgi:anti-anti-sigma factor